MLDLGRLLFLRGAGGGLRDPGGDAPQRGAQRDFSGRRRCWPRRESFCTLHAEFLFIVQIILYAGGIMVLFVFVIMLVNLDVALHQVQFNRQWLVALLLTLVLGGAGGRLALTLSRGSLYTLPPAPATALEPNTEQVAWSLFHTYMLPFELASILLLVAMIGAVVMSKKRV